VECIICRINKDPSHMSDEHVIPDSLGGYYHIYNVCTPCNSKLGQTVDGPLVNHKLTELYRFIHQRAGKTGAIPNPFAGAISVAENPSIRARATTDDEGNLSFTLLPNVRVQEADGSAVSIEISVDAREEGSIQEILDKKLERMGIDPARTIRNDLTRGSHDGGFTSRWAFDTRDFKIGLLKIAYEFAVDSVKDFFETDEANEIARILREADYGSAERFVKFGSGLQDKIFEPFLDFLDLNSNKHYLVLIDSEMGLLCFIKLHALFCVGVVLTQRGLLADGEAYFGINDIDGRSFRKLTFEDVLHKCLGPTYIQLGYFFHTEEQARVAAAEIQVPGFTHEVNAADEFQFYDVAGNKDPRTLSELTADAPCSAQREGSWFEEVFDLDHSEQIFIRSVGAGKFYRVSSIKVSRQPVRKL